MSLLHKLFRGSGLVSGSFLLIVCLAFSCSVQAAPSTTYSAVDDFTIAANPNGVWSYLYGSGTLLPIAVTGSGVNAGLIYWWNGSTDPNSAAIVRNVSGSTWVSPDGNVYLPPEFLNLDPQGVGNVDVRFTAPLSSFYKITGSFLGVNLYEHPHPVEIAFNGNVIVSFPRALTAYNQSEPFNFTVSLQAGDQIDFESLTGLTGDWTYLGTGLSATVAPTPEPTCLLLLASGFAAVGETLRRRLQK